MARNQKLNVEITADDKASAKITDVAKKVDKTDGRKATVKVDGDTSGLIEALEEIDGPIGDIAGRASELTDKFGGKAGVAGGVAAIGAGLLAAADYAADAAIEVGEVAALTGDSVEAASRLNGVWRQGGFDTADLKDVLLQMNGVLRDSPELAEQLGINLDDGRTVGERFTEVVDKLGDDFTEAGERSQLASKLFGEEGVRQVSAVQRAFGDLTDAVENYNGKVFTQDQIQDAYKSRQRVTELKQEWNDAVVSVGQYAMKLYDLGKNAFLAPARFFESLTGGYNAFDTSATVAEFEDAARAAQLFDRSILASATSFDEVHAMVLQVTGSLTAANMIAAEWAKANQDAADVMADEVSPAADMIAAEIDKARRNVERFGSDGVENMGDVEDAAGDASDAVDDVKESFARLRQEISNRTAYRQLQDQFDEVEAKAKEAWTAAAEGAEDADQKARDYQQSLDDLRLDVIEYGDTITGLPEQFTTNILAMLDAGKVAEAEAWMTRVQTGVTLPIRPQIIRTGSNTSIRVDEHGNVKAMDTGGVVPGRQGEMVPIMAHAGEVVLPAHRSDAAARATVEAAVGGGTAVAAGSSMPENITVNVTVTPVVDNRQTVNWHDTAKMTGREIVDALNAYYRAGGAQPRAQGRGWR